MFVESELEKILGEESDDFEDRSTRFIFVAISGDFDRLRRLASELMNRLCDRDMVEPRMQIDYRATCSTPEAVPNVRIWTDVERRRVFVVDQA